MTYDIMSRELPIAYRAAAHRRTMDGVHRQRARTRADAIHRAGDPIQGITPKVLVETLRSLEEDGLVSRTVFDENPPHVEYELTELGRSLLVPLRAVREWAEEHVPAVLAARAALRPTDARLVPAACPCPRFSESAGARSR